MPNPPRRRPDARSPLPLILAAAGVAAVVSCAGVGAVLYFVFTPARNDAPRDDAPRDEVKRGPDAAGPRPGWKRYAPAGGGFQALFPAAPGPAGVLHTRPEGKLYEARAGDVTASVGVTRLVEEFDEDEFALTAHMRDPEQDLTVLDDRRVIWLGEEVNETSYRQGRIETVVRVAVVRRVGYIGTVRFAGPLRRAEADAFFDSVEPLRK